VALLLSFTKELYKVEELMNREIRLKLAKTDDLIDIKAHNLDKRLCSSLVLAVGRTMKEAENAIISLAAVVQYIYLAHHIHGLVSDDTKRDGCHQYHVLFGDFLFGQSFLKLCESELFNFAGQFVQVIGTMNEGILMRWRMRNKTISTKDYKIIISKERAALLALAAKLGGVLAGIKEPELKKIESYGHSIGMAWAAWEDSLYPTLVNEYFDKAKATIQDLSPFLHVKPLQELYDFFYTETKYDSLLYSVK